MVDKVMVEELKSVPLFEYNNGNIPHTNSTPLNSEKEFLYMKATGIVRRIDELGRVVVPKEIRRTLRIREGDPLLTMLTEYGKADGEGDCGECKDGRNKKRGEVLEGVKLVKRELFVSGVVGLCERVGK